MGVDAGKKAETILDGLSRAIDKAMDECQLEIAGAITELVSDIKSGKQAAVRHIQSERLKVQQKFSGMFGNMPPAEEAPKAEAETARPTNGGAS